MSQFPIVIAKPGEMISLLEAWLPIRLTRASHRRGAPSTSAPSSRTEVCPPQLWPSSLTLWGRVQRWLARDGRMQRKAGRSTNRLSQVKSEFADALDGLEGDEASLLAQRIDCARSLRELWHLRCVLYGQLSLVFSQSEAESRLARLNRHFPTRSPRSIDAPVDPS